jgi:hypothetical protein
MLVTVERGRSVYVDATLASPAQPPSGNRVRVQLAAEKPLARDNAAVVRVVLFLQVLVAVCAALTWSRWRWGRRETLIVGVPMVLAAAFLVARSVATALLPNLL